MRGLMLKDLLVMRKNGSMLVFALLPSFLFLLNGGLDMFAMMIMLLCCSMGLGFYNYDETAKATSFIRALPVNARQIVTARYVSQLALCFMGMIIGVCVTLAAGAGTIQFLAGAMAMITVCVGLASPLMYRFGTTNGRLVMMGVTFGTVALGFLLVRLMNTELVGIGQAELSIASQALGEKYSATVSQGEVIADAVNARRDQLTYIAMLDEAITSHLPGLVAGGIALCAALLGISWAASCRIVARRE